MTSLAKEGRINTQGSKEQSLYPPFRATLGKQDVLFYLLGCQQINMVVPLGRKVKESWKLDVKNYREEITREIKRKKKDSWENKGRTNDKCNPLMRRFAEKGHRIRQ